MSAAKPTASEVADNLLDHYGTCVRGTAGCHCLKEIWLGQGCGFWRPWGVTTFAELKQRMAVENGAKSATPRTGIA